jgi:hypothetical protein
VFGAPTPGPAPEEELSSIPAVSGEQRFEANAMDALFSDHELRSFYDEVDDDGVDGSFLPSLAPIHSK